MASDKLSAKQLRALRACADPDSEVGLAFWHDARARLFGRPCWPGMRRTLGSLHARGLVSYDQNGWSATDAGRAWLRAWEAAS